MDQNDSGELDFVEFLVGLWNVCTFDEESALKFAFSIYDYDDDGYIRAGELSDLIKGVHGDNYNKKTATHIKNFLRQFDTDSDRKYSFEEFRQAKQHFPSLFGPAYVLQMRCQEEIYGEYFWARAAGLRRKQKDLQNMRGLSSIIGSARASMGGGSSSSTGGGAAAKPGAREQMMRLSGMNIRGTRVGGSSMGGEKASRSKFVYHGEDFDEANRYVHPVQEQARQDIEGVERFSLTQRIRAGKGIPRPPRNDKTESPFQVTQFNSYGHYIAYEMDRREAMDRGARMGFEGRESTRGSSRMSTRGSMNKPKIPINMSGTTTLSSLSTRGSTRPRTAGASRGGMTPRQPRPATATGRKANLTRGQGTMNQDAMEKRKARQAEEKSRRRQEFRAMNDHFKTSATPWEVKEKYEREQSEARGSRGSEPPPEVPRIIPSAAQIIAGEFTVDQLLEKQAIQVKEEERKEKSARTPRKSQEPLSSRERALDDIKPWERRKDAHELAPPGTPRRSGTPPKKPRPGTPPRRAAGAHQHTGTPSKMAPKGPQKGGRKSIKMNMPDELLRYSAGKRDTAES